MGKATIGRKQFTAYMIVAFGLAWILEIIASIFGNNGNQMVFRIIMVITMFMPFIATLIAGIPLKGMGWVPQLKGKIRYVFFALWMPALLSIIGGVLFFIIFPKAFDPEFLTLRGLMEAAGALELLESQGLTIPMHLPYSLIFLNLSMQIGQFLVQHILVLSV